MVQYEPMTKMILPSVKFSDIYSYMTREKHDEDGKRSHRLLDRAVAHFQAGDVQDIMFAEVTYQFFFTKFPLGVGCLCIA